MAETKIPDVDKLLQDILRIDQRARSRGALEQARWDVWAYVRENKDSLDSEHACKMIDELIGGAICELQKRLESLVVEADLERNACKEQRAKLREVRAEHRATLDDLAKAEIQVMQGHKAKLEKLARVQKGSDSRNKQMERQVRKLEREKKALAVELENSTKQEAPAVELEGEPEEQQKLREVEATV